MHIHANLAEQLHINEQNLRQRKQFRRMRQHIVYTRPCSLSSTRT
jgi:hypothetical protein